MTDYTTFLPSIGADTDFYDKYSDLLDALNTDIDSATDYTDFLPAPYVDTDFAVKFAGLLQALDNDLPSPTISYISKLPAIGADKDFAINYSAILTALNEEDFIGAPSDPEWANVSLLIYGEDDITDETGKTITINGNTALSSSQAKFGANSIYFDGSGDYLQLASSEYFNFADGDFTVECLAYITSFSSNGTFIDLRSGTGANNNFQLGHNTANGLSFNTSNGATTVTHALSLNTWHYITLVRDSGVIKLFVDGVLLKTVSYSHTMSAGYLYVGRYSLITTADFKGYMEQIRITKGVARYTASFTPPTEPFPNS
jgi:hypothetical protein